MIVYFPVSLPGGGLKVFQTRFLRLKAASRMWQKISGGRLVGERFAIFFFGAVQFPVFCARAVVQFVNKLITPLVRHKVSVR